MTLLEFKHHCTYTEFKHGRKKNIFFFYFIYYYGHIWYIQYKVHKTVLCKYSVWKYFCLLTIVEQVFFKTQWYIQALAQLLRISVSLLKQHLKKNGSHIWLMAKCQFGNLSLKIHFTVHFTAMDRHASCL